jgi:hypothetical protein
MKNKFILALIYIIFFFNSNLLSEGNNKVLKIGLLAPLSGSYSELGNSILHSLQLALEEILVLMIKKNLMQLFKILDQKE